MVFHIITIMQADKICYFDILKDLHNINNITKLRWVMRFRFNKMILSMITPSLDRPLNQWLKDSS